MKTNGKKGIVAGIGLVVAFVIWTLLVRFVDVQPAGVNGTNIGFATVNTWFHKLTGEHMWIYNVTDWLGLVPILICVCFGGLGVMQWIKRKSLKKVDPDIILLGIYYVAVIFAYLLFEKIPINYRSILIKGAMEASYPSSTTLLVLSVMAAFGFQIARRVQNPAVRKPAIVCTALFSAFMVIGRLVSGVHWLTDIIGAVLLSAGLYLVYRSAVIIVDQKRDHR